MSDDVRALLDPLAAVQDARPKFREIPESTYQPPPTDDDPSPDPIVIPASTQVYTDPAQLPEEIITPTGGIDLGGQLALVQAALGRLSDVEIRGVHASVVFNTTLVWAGGSVHDVVLTWDTAPLAPVQFAIPRLDISIAFQGKVICVVKADSFTSTGCTVTVTVVSAGSVTINSAAPLSVHADGIYNYNPPFTG